MKKFVLLVVAMLIIGLPVFVACARPSTPPPTDVVPVPRPPAPAPTVVPAPAPRPAPAPAPPPPIIVVTPAPGFGRDAGALPSQAIAQDRLIIRNADVSLVVKDVVQTRDDIAQLATRLDGFVVSSAIFGKDRDLRGNVVIRVPDGKFDTALVEIRKLAVRVSSERTSSQDVTEEYTDLKARLKNAEATEAQLQEILKRADKVEDILKVYQQLSQVRQEIERLKGRIQYLERLSAMSLISVNLEPEVSAEPLVSPVWSFPEVVKAAVRGLVSFGQWLVSALVWIVVFLPLWGGLVLLIYWLLRKMRIVSGPHPPPAPR